MIEAALRGGFFLRSHDAAICNHYDAACDNPGRSAESMSFAANNACWHRRLDW